MNDTIAPFSIFTPEPILIFSPQRVTFAPLFITILDNFIFCSEIIEISHPFLKTVLLEMSTLPLAYIRISDPSEKITLPLGLMDPGFPPILISLAQNVKLLLNCKSVDCQDAGYLTTNLRRATVAPSARGYLTTIFFRATTAPREIATTIYTPCGQADTSIEIVSLSPRCRTAMPSSPYISRRSHPGAVTVWPS